MSTVNLRINSDNNESVFYSESGYETLPRIEDRNELNPFCGYHQAILPMKEDIAVGFGRASLTKDNECVYLNDDMTVPNYDNFMTVAQAEALAAADPKHDWRIHFIAPLSGRSYQRQGKQNWVLYQKGAGFA